MKIMNKNYLLSNPIDKEMMILDRERIEEILDSKGVIEVTYHDNPVWIESMNRDDDQRVEIRNLNTDEILNVNIDDLME